MNLRVRSKGREPRILAVAFGFLLACGRPTKERASSAAPAPSSATSARESPRPIVEPTRLIALDVSAYSTTLALDDDAVYLMTANAAYRLVPGEPPQGIQLELGIGPTLTPSAFIFWSNGAIWRAPKTGGVTRAIAKVSREPQYFVAFGEDFAWIELSEQGEFSIQTLDGSKPRVLVTAKGEISALHAIGKDLYFVERPTDATWRLGVVGASGGEPRYGSAKQGRRPAALAGVDDLYYYELDSSEIRRRSLDLGRDEAASQKLVCSPISVASAIYCGSVEGLFQVDKATRAPRVLAYGRPGSITNVVANAQRIAWSVDLGPGKLAVDMLPVSRAD